MLMVAVGGGVGSALRYGLTRRIGVDETGFPAATFAVNVVGSLVLGVLIGMLAARVSADIRAGLFVGLLGGFTTYSTFSFESVALVREGTPGIAVTYVVASIVVGLSLAWVGLVIGESLA
jgi:CrcB protein